VAAKPAPRALELSPEAARELTARLKRLVQAEASHGDPDNSLPRLAALMDITPQLRRLQQPQQLLQGIQGEDGHDAERLPAAAAAAGVKTPHGKARPLR